MHDSKQRSDSILIDADTPGYDVDSHKIRLIVSSVLESYGLAHTELSICLVSVEEIAKVNLTFRNKADVTDVLSFPQNEWPRPFCLSSDNSGEPQLEAEPLNSNLGPVVLGDLVLCLDRAKENAVSIGHGLDRETAFLLVHGILHLLGHDHQNQREEAIMLEEQRELMRRLGEPPSGSPLWSHCVAQIEGNHL